MIMDWTISLGHIIQLFGFLLGGIGFGFMLKADIRLLSQRVANLEKITQQIGEVLTTLARQDERLAGLSTRILHIEEYINRIRNGKA